MWQERMKRESESQGTSKSATMTTNDDDHRQQSIFRSLRFEVLLEEDMAPPLEEKEQQLQRVQQMIATNLTLRTVTGYHGDG